MNIFIGLKNFLENTIFIFIFLHFAIFGHEDSSVCVLLGLRVKCAYAESSQMDIRG